MAWLRSMIVPLSIVGSLGLSSAVLAEDLKLAEAEDSELISQAEAEIEIDRSDENGKDWRTYVDLYGFLPWQTQTDLTIDGFKAPTLNQNLGEVLDPATAVFTGRVGVEFGRFGLQLGVNHGASHMSDIAAKWDASITNPIRGSQKYSETFQGLKEGRRVALDTPRLPNREERVQERVGERRKKIAKLVKDRRLNTSGDIEVDSTFDQTVIDLALRYRAGDVPSPRMKPGDFTFIGLAGARIVDANLNTDIDFSNDVTFEGVFVDDKLRKKFERSASSNFSNTWVSPMIGMNAIYAINDQWQVFTYLDMAGFGVSGKEDMSGTAQAGIAYTIGNSTQLSLSYKYWGIDFAGYGSNNKYSVAQSGVNLGLRFFFD